jgi:(p)ppGpp synthase/HD superfamily hydrolase
MQNDDALSQVIFSCKYSKRLLDKVSLINDSKTQNDKVDITEIQKALYYAMKYHGDQKRQSGESYYSHPIEVAYMISDYLFRTDIIVSSILHDTLEDTTLTFKMIEDIFGSLVANQVMDLTRITKSDGDKITSSEMVQSLFKHKKYDVLLIKQFDRLHNMQTIGVKSPDKIKKITEETISTFSVLAAFLGIRGIEEQLIQSCITSSTTNPEDKCDNIFRDKDALLLSLMFQNDVLHI